MSQPSIYESLADQLPEPDRLLGHRKTAGRSKLKLWVCCCRPKPVRVRVGRATLRARCLDCGCDFELASPLGTATEMSQ